MSETRKRARNDAADVLFAAVAKDGHLAACEVYLQAREDVKRLAARLRAVTADGHDREDCASLPGPCDQPCNCETGALLSEVGQ